MSEARQDDADLTREEWTALLEPARRRSRFTYAMRRARRDVEVDPHLTDAELTAVAQIFLDARKAAS
jgi:hypothetical protein